MPELPEVETIANGLRQGGYGHPPLLGRRIEAVHLLWKRTLASPAQEEFEQRLVGQVIQSRWGHLLAAAGKPPFDLKELEQGREVAQVLVPRAGAVRVVVGRGLGEGGDVDGDAAVGAVRVRVHPGAGLHLQHLPGVVQGPDAEERHIQIVDQQFGTPLQDVPQLPVLAKSGSYLRP